jgi:hypothetical protein
MKTTKRTWVYVESGECVEARSVEGAIELLQPWYRGCELTPANVVTEEEAMEILRRERACNPWKFFWKE